MSVKNNSTAQMPAPSLLSIAKSGKHAEMLAIIRKVNNIHRDARAAKHSKYQKDNRRYFDMLEVRDSNPESALYKLYQNYNLFNKLGIYVSNEYKFYLCSAVNTALMLHKSRKLPVAYTMVEYLIRYTAKYIKQSDPTFRQLPSTHWNNSTKYRLIVLHKNIKKYKFAKRHKEAVNIMDIDAVFRIMSEITDCETVDELSIMQICKYCGIDEPALYDDADLLEPSDIFINDPVTDDTTAHVQSTHETQQQQQHHDGEPDIPDESPNSGYESMDDSQMTGVI